MKFLLEQPLEVRLLALFFLGLCIGSIVNWAIYALAWTSRPISPWSRPTPAAPRRSAWDKLPLWGWIRLRRESDLHGRGFWIRPMLIELLCGLGLAWLYWWEVAQQGLLPFDTTKILPYEWTLALHAAFFSHVVLIGLMLAASMIDVDEMMIPDEITVTGTLVGLVLAAAWPHTLLPVVSLDPTNQLYLGFLTLASPNAMPVWLGGLPHPWSLVLALACWVFWCFSLLPRTWYTRRGLWQAVRLCVSRILNERVSYRIFRMGIVGALAIAIVWSRGGQSQSGWAALLSSLVGMAASGGIIWLVRIVCTAVLKREAMGFGDVTLMAMIGAFVGWQAAIVVFFLAPLAGLLISIPRLILFRDREIPYGPFLCLATLAVILGWNDVWLRTADVYGIGWLVPTAMLICPLAMGFMLGAWQLIVGLFR